MSPSLVAAATAIDRPTPRSSPRHSLRLPLLAALLLPLVAGCDADYYIQLAAGQLSSINRSMPIETAINDATLDLTDRERSKLTLVVRARQFGIDRLGLTPGDAYTQFELDASNGVIAFALAASDKTSLTPFQWYFPIFGLQPSRLYFDEALGQREADRLEDRDFDVFFGRVEGFSTLGVFADAIRRSNLRLDEIEIAELVLHEITHNTVISLSNVNFDESLATFVGRRGAQMWFDETFGPDSDEAMAARRRFADKAVIDAYVAELFTHMERYYMEAAARDLSRDEILTGREAEFADLLMRYQTEFRPQLAEPNRWVFNEEAELNNARILVGIRYQGTLDVYADVLDRVGGSFPDAIAVFNDAAATDAPRQFLEDWLATGP